MARPTSLSLVYRSQAMVHPTATTEDLHTTLAVLPTPAPHRTTVQPPTRNSTPAVYKDSQSSGAAMIRIKRTPTRTPDLILNRPTSKVSPGCPKASRWSLARRSSSNNPLSTPHVVGVTTSTDPEAGTAGVVTDHTATLGTSSINPSFIPIPTTAHRGIGDFF